MLYSHFIQYHVLNSYTRICVLLKKNNNKSTDITLNYVIHSIMVGFLTTIFHSIFKNI